MAKNQPRRQKVRRALVLIAFLLFPVVLNYLSPYLIIVGASEGVVNGSMLVFGLFFVSALFLGRGYCGWVCPAGGLQDACFVVVDKKVQPRKIDWIKWLIWVPWVGIIAAMAISAGGYRVINPFFMTDEIISVIRLEVYIIYYTVVAAITTLSFTVGSRAFCHAGCWMAPFFILGRKLRNLFGWPSLQLVAKAEKCNDCTLCNRACPMSLDVNGMVKAIKMEHSECILCGSCVDNCPRSVIAYQFGRLPVSSRNASNLPNKA